MKKKNSNSDDIFIIPASHYHSNSPVSKLPKGGGQITSAGNNTFTPPASEKTGYEENPSAKNGKSIVEEESDREIQKESGKEPTSLGEDNEKKQRVAERPQILAERNAKRVSALSLKSIQQKQRLQQELVANQPSQDNLPEEQFSEKEMQKAWKDYTAIVEEEGKFNLLSHLTMGLPKLENDRIQLSFPNHTIKTEVERAKFQLLEFLRSRLQNYSIDLEITVDEKAEKKFVYSSRDKFEKMREKNPALEKLRTEFDLDI